MFDDARRIFDLLSRATLPPGEADRVLTAVKRATAENTPTPSSPISAVHVAVDGLDAADTQTMRLPVALLHTGLRYVPMLPGGAAQKLEGHLRQHGIDVPLPSLTRAQLEAILADVRHVTIDVPAEQVQVRITAE